MWFHLHEYQTRQLEGKTLTTHWKEYKGCWGNAKNFFIA